MRKHVRKSLCFCFLCNSVTTRMHVNKTHHKSHRIGVKGKLHKPQTRARGQRSSAATWSVPAVAHLPGAPPRRRPRPRPSPAPSPPEAPPPSLSRHAAPPPPERPLTHSPARAALPPMLTSHPHSCSPPSPLGPCPLPRALQTADTSRRRLLARLKRIPRGACKEKTAVGSAPLPQPHAPKHPERRGRSHSPPEAPFAPLGRLPPRSAPALPHGSSATARARRAEAGPGA